MPREFDFLVYGASGFTGKRVVPQLLATAPKGPDGKPLTFAIAGRNEAKLIVNASSTTIPVLVADVSNEEDLKAVFGRARVVINCVGPFRYYGESVVKAAIAAGTDYVDITGETEFVEKMCFKYHDMAVEKGVRVVHCCGFDCIPAEMGVVFTKEQYKGTQVPSTIEMFVRIKNGPSGGGFHYTTYEAAVQSFQGVNELRALRKQVNRPSIPAIGPKLVFNQKPHWDPRIKAYLLPFIFADPSIVRLSQQILLQHPTSPHPTNRPVQFAAYLVIPKLRYLIMVVMYMTVFNFLMKFDVGRKILLKHPKFFTAGLFSRTGPTPQQTKDMRFETKMISRGYSAPPANKSTEPDVNITTVISGQDPGYGGTSIMVVACAITTLLERDSIPTGVITPAVAFKQTKLIGRLREMGIKFEVEGKVE
ncbi:hypothetical protein HK104_001577 [Borealophlyctis nickersoniae]|nr:hypothetical protein HK104_001577 [Borealophlyctis nickersoniae]